jgi:class 3 adenylate cyclase
MFARLYRRWGPRYPMRLLAATVRFEYAVVILGAAGLGLYVEMSLSDFLLLAALGVIGQEIYAQRVLRYFRTRLQPLEHWIAGARASERTQEAWTVAASMPFELLRIWWRTIVALPAGFIWSVFAIWLLGLPAWAIPILFVAAEVVLAYGNGIVFFVMERAMQPVLDDLAESLTDEADVEAIRLSLRLRLLTAVPAINVMTGVAVAGLVEGGAPGLGALGIAVGVSLLVAMTLAFAFTVLLADSVVAPIRRLEKATESVGAGDLSTRVPVSAADETGTLTQAFNRMLSGLQERARLREAFGTFVDPNLAERVARDGTDLRGEELEVSILFMDVRGFTTFSENAPAAEVVARLNELYEIVVPLITGHGGHANKFIGDGLLAVFGAPVRHSDHADRAVAAALAIAQDVQQHFQGALEVGLGVNSGSVVVGTIGGGGRLDFTVIGDAVNTAARVESATRQTGDQLLITEATRQRLSDPAINWESRPAMPLKGKSEEVALFAPPQPIGVASKGA